VGLKPDDMVVSPKSKPNKRYWVSSLILLVFSWCFFLIFWLKKEPFEQFPSVVNLFPLTSSEGLNLFPTWSPDGKWIAYASDEGGNLNILKKSIKGGKVVRLTSGPENETQPAWSPDGRSIAFCMDDANTGIFLIPAEGGVPYSITTFGKNPAWSPDNSKLAFHWNGDIYVISVNGGDPRLLVEGTTSNPFMTWSPDNQKLIFWNRTKGDIYSVSVASGLAKPLRLVFSGDITIYAKDRWLVFSKGPFGGKKNLWIVEFASGFQGLKGKPTLLCVTPTEDIQCKFSPDGREIAFTARSIERHLWALPINLQTGFASGPLKQITFKGKLNYYPASSANGNHLIWTSHQSGSGNLYVFDMNQNMEWKVTNEWELDVREIGGSFSPDGRQISFSSTLGGSYQLWKIPRKGSIELPLTRTSHPIRDTLTAWSPNGNTIAYFSNRSGNWDIWTIEAFGKGKRKQITTWKSNEMYPVWSPDSRLLAFTTDRDGNGDIWIFDTKENQFSPYIVHDAEEGWGCWFPDRDWFYFTSNRSGVFNVWLKSSKNKPAQIVTRFQGVFFGLPEFALFTKFTISGNRLILPVETRKGDIYIIDLKN